MSVQARPATGADLGVILDLRRRNSVGGDGAYYYNGLPDKPGYQLYLLEWEGRPVGTASACREQLGELPVLYLGDGMLDRSARGRGLMHAASRDIVERLLTPEISFLTGLSPAGNRQSRRMLFESEHVHVRFETPFEFRYLPSLFAREPEVTTDFVQVCDLVNRFYSGHNFYRALTPEALARRRDFEVLVQREGGEMVAAVGVWRQRYARKLMVAAPGLVTRAAMRLFQAANPRLESVVDGNARELVAPVLTEPAFKPGHERAFSRLLRTLGWRKDAHAFRIVFHPESAIAPLVPRRFVFAFRTNFLIFQGHPAAAQFPEVRGPVYYDFSWLP